MTHNRVTSNVKSPYEVALALCIQANCRLSSNSFMSCSLISAKNCLSKCLKEAENLSHSDSHHGNDCLRVLTVGLVVKYIYNGLDHRGRPYHYNDNLDSSMNIWDTWPHQRYRVYTYRVYTYTTVT